MSNKLIAGKVGGPYGVRGWVKVLSHTDPRENLFSYSPWWLKIDGKWQEVELEDAREQGKGFIAKLSGIADCDQARSFINCDIAILEQQLPSLDEGEFYWRDLIGLEVFDQAGFSFGKVTKMIETGANDVLVVKGDRERLLPYIDSVVLKVDITASKLLVDWDKDF